MATLYGQLSTKLGTSLFEEVQRAPILRPKLTPSLFLATVYALLVHGITVLIALAGLLLIVAPWFNLFTLLVGLFLLATAWAIRPRVHPFPQSYCSKDDFPTLYAVVDRVAEAIDAPPPSAIVVTPRFNASYGRAGWRRKHVLTLGLPLLAILDERETIAVIGHELAHAVNGDYARGRLIGSAIESLSRWYVILYPSRFRTRSFGLAELGAMVANVMLFGAAAVVRLAALALSHLLWRDSQRAEYLADHLAAQVAGTGAMLGLLDKLHLDATFHTSVQFVAIQSRTSNLFQEMHERVAGMPEHERERIRRLGRLEASRLDSTHPPTYARIALLETRPAEQGRVQVSRVEWEAFQRELHRIDAPMQKVLVDRYRRSLEG